VKTPIAPPNAGSVAATLTPRSPSFNILHGTVLSISLLLCAFLGLEGGYQLHRSHDHSALSCALVAMAASASYDAVPYGVSPPPCKAPDEAGQPWRLGLVMLDLLGFLVFGVLGMYEGRQLTLIVDAPPKPQ
jgi:hypothetical protein